MKINDHLRLAHVLAHLLDDDIKILGWKFGLDPLIGLLPISGDLVSAGLSFYLVWVGWKIKVPEDKLVQMIRNILVDFAVGVLPVVGDAADFMFKSNLKNLEILKIYAPKIVDG